MGLHSGNMGLNSGTMAHTLVVVVVTVAFLAVTVKSVDHRCRYFETKVDNCTRKVYYRCPENTESSEESSEEDAPLSRKRRSLENFLASIMRQFYTGGDSNDEWCVKEETFKCVMYRCYIACCPGWKYDEVNGTCSIREHPKPAIECQNGGSAMVGRGGRAFCKCPAMYTGDRCESVMCTLDCQNDGMCDMVDGAPKCVCSEDFRGSRCQTPVCQGGCGKHGRCIAEDGQARCQCKHGYRGRNCEIRIPKPEKPGDCPPVTPGSMGSCAEMCQEDSHCPNKQKCCSNGCGRTCREPAVYTCRHNGTDYKIGSIFKPDACHTCVCLTPDPKKPFGGALCRAPTCPPLKEGCQKVVKYNNSCCVSCAVPSATKQKTTGNPTTEKPEETTDVPKLDYEEPRFLNCPDSIVTIDVAGDRNEATLPFTLEARDHRDNKLEVTLPRTVFRAGRGAQNFDTVMATSARDYANEFAQCEFFVRIRDVHAPNFTFCPTDVHVTKEGPVTWELPKAVDNVGIARPPTSSKKPGDYFRKGEHSVVYSSEDFEGNIARCHFFVKVAVPGGSHMGSGGQEHEDKNRHLMFIGSGIAAFLFIVVIIIVAVMCRRRHRLRRDPTTPPPPAYENGIYNVGAVVPPPYKEKPPVYVSESVPEKKEPLEETEKEKAPLDAGDVDIKMGVDNPTYRM